MFGDVGRAHEHKSPDRQFGNWRIVVSAWLLVLVFVMLLAAVDAVACRRVGSHSKARFAGTVIPQHEPCAGPGIPSAVNIDGCESAPLHAERHGYW
jgi:hypothetical protein